MPDWKQLVRMRLQGSGLSAEEEADVVEELAQDLEQRYGEAISNGASAEQAEATTMSSIAGVAMAARIGQARRRGKNARIEVPERAASRVSSLVYDLKYAYRGLRWTPGFTIAALLCLALGIGANTAIFQIVNAVRLRLLPIPDADKLVELHIPDMKGARGDFRARHAVVTFAQWERLRERQQAFDLFAWYRDEFNVAESGEARVVQGLEVSGGFFNILRLKPAAGRLLQPSDDVAGCGTPAVVISYQYWQREFGGGDVIGRKLTLERYPFQIVAVAPPNFYGLEVGRTFDVAVPLCAEPLLQGEFSGMKSASTWWLTMMGRLKPGWTREKASAELSSLSPGIFEATLPAGYPQDAVADFLKMRFDVYPAGNGISDLRRDYSSPLWLLLSIAGLLLLIACANLANLLLARANTRWREFAVRLALGASRARLLRQMMAESLLLATGGATIALIVSVSLSRVLVSLLRSERTAVFLDMRTDFHVLLFTAVVACFTCILFGLAPALQATRIDPAAALNSGGRAGLGSRSSFGLRRALMATQVALSVVLLVAALLFTRSLRNLLEFDPGFEESGLLVLGLEFRAMNLPPERRLPFRDQILEEIKHQPGIENAAQTEMRPLSGSAWDDTVFIDGQDRSRSKQVFLNRVSPGFFATMGMPLRMGRDFSQSDGPNAPLVAVVNESFVRTLLAGQDPIGKIAIAEPTPNEPQARYQIIGVVKDAKYRDLREDYVPQVYLTSGQTPKPNEYARYLVRSRIPIADAIHELNGMLKSAAPQVSVYYRVLRTEVEDSLIRERLVARLSLFFGVIATVLATVGLYGVISYSVSRRTNEIGVRIALGATRGNVMRLVLNEAAGLVSIGLVIGIVVAIALGKVAASMLFGLKPYDPVTLIATCVMLSAIALIASAVPALRASRLDPMTALREG